MRPMLPVALTLALMGVGCDNSAQSNTAPTAVPLTTETFTGERGSGRPGLSPLFTVAQVGEVDITLTAVGPPATIFMGLGVGTPTDTACSLNITGGSISTQAGAVPQLVGTASAGALCVAVFDIGNQTAAVTYSITVAHP